MNLYSTWVFVNVAQLQSVTAAAKHLSISQPAASSHIRALEADLQVILLERLPRGVALTDIGRAYFDQALQVFAELEKLNSVARGRQAWGKVQIAASFTPGVYWIPAKISQFQAEFPDLQCELSLQDSSRCAEKVLNYEVPMAVVGELPLLGRSRGLIRTLVAQDSLALTVLAGHPLAGIKSLDARQRKELLRERLILREQGSSTRSEAESMLKRLGSFEKLLELSSSEAVKEAVIAGLGIAVLSSWSVAREVATGLLQQITVPLLRQSRNVYAIRRQDRPLAGPAAKLWNFLCEKSTTGPSRQVRKPGEEVSQGSLPTIERTQNQ